MAKDSTPAKRSRTSGHASATSNPGNRTTAKGSCMTLDNPDVLDCPICFQPLNSPVYQCENGHIACDSCCTTTLKNKCSICCLPIGNIRNRAIEIVVESVRITCQNQQYGCKEVFSYGKKVGHEKECNFFPCSCPCCDYVGTSKRLYNHFSLKHKASSEQFKFSSKIYISMDTTETRVILREGKGVLFILNRCVQRCLSCTTSLKRKDII